MKDVLKNVTDEKLQQTFLDDLCELAQEAYTVAESDDLSTELKRFSRFWVIYAIECMFVTSVTVAPML